MLKKFRDLVGGFVASEDAVRKQAILPLAWVGAVMMAAAVVVSMPEKAHADYCWAAWCYNTSPSICTSSCNTSCYSWSSGCVPYGSSGLKRCRCGWP